MFFDHPCTYADSHTFAIPNNDGKPQTPEKHAAVLEVIKWMEEHSLFWATAGHIPANKAVTDSAEYKAMQPQATYAVLTANMVFDPKSKFAGVASPLFDAAGNAFTAADQRRGRRRPTRSTEMKEALDALAVSLRFLQPGRRRAMAPAGSFRSGTESADAEEQAQRDSRRGRPGRALRRRSTAGCSSTRPSRWCS